MRRVRNRIIAAVLFAVFSFICLSGCTEKDKREYEGFFFDTFVTIRIYGGSDQILDDAVALCREYDRLLSKTNPSSDIWALNNADGKPVEVDERTAELINLAMYYAQLSEERFDITCGSVTELWNFKADEPVLPETEKIEQALEYVGSENISVNDNTVTLRPGTKLDLGGVAKGYIADRVAEFLRLNGVKNAVLNFGGNVVAIGDKFGDNYNIGIESPNGEGYAMSLKVADKSVVTAGTYQRGFVLDGVYYHHILDLTTGMPVNNGLASVSVIAESSAEGDALATTCFLMGLESGLDLAESIDGVEAVFITDSGQIYTTSGI